MIEKQPNKQKKCRTLHSVTSGFCREELGTTASLQKSDAVHLNGICTNQAPLWGKGVVVKDKTFNKLYPGLITLLTEELPLNIHFDITSPSDYWDQKKSVLRAIKDGEPCFFVAWKEKNGQDIAIEPVELPKFFGVIIVSRKQWHLYFPGVPCITQLVHQFLLCALLPEIEKTLDVRDGYFFIR